MTDTPKEKVLRDALEAISKDREFSHFKGIGGIEHERKVWYKETARIALDEADRIGREEEGYDTDCVHGLTQNCPEGCHEKPSPAPADVSACCRAQLKVESADEGTSFYRCEKCGRATDPAGGEVTELGDTIPKILGELAGAASLCWEPKPSGVFDSKTALRYCDEARERLNALLSRPAQDREAPGLPTDTLYQKFSTPFPLSSIDWERFEKIEADHYASIQPDKSIGFLLAIIRLQREHLSRRVEGPEHKPWCKLNTITKGSTMECNCQPRPASQGDAEELGIECIRLQQTINILEDSLRLTNARAETYFDRYVEACKDANDLKHQVSALTPPVEFQEKECIICHGDKRLYPRGCAYCNDNGKVWVKK